MRPLRIGLLLDGTRLQRWQAWCVETLLARGDIRVEVAICNRAEPIGPTAGLRKQLSRLRRLPTRFGDLPWILLNRADRRFAQRDRSGLGAMVDEVDLATLPAEATRLDALPQSSASGLYHWLESEDVDAIRRHDLDLLLRFGFNILQGEVLDAARHGVWSFHHADNRINRGGPPGFWEVAGEQPVTGAVVQRLTEQLDNGTVLARGWYPTNPISWNRNFYGVLAQSRTLLTDAVSHLARTGEPPAPPPEPVNVYAHPLYRKPTAGVALRTAARCVARRTRGKIQKKTARPQWHVRWGVADADGLSVHRLHRLTPPADRFWADPFPYTAGGRTWLFVEELLYATNRGRIAALEVSGATVERHAVALETSYHLSYPFPFEHDGILYMIPESAANGTVELWQCTRFPDQWTKLREILRGVSAVDSTLLPHEGRYYLFTNMARQPESDHATELHIFMSDDPITGDWHAHPRNPVIVDSRCARMAGGFLGRGEHGLVRCAQFKGTRYGEALSLRSVETLTPEDYSETGIGHVTADWEPGLAGTHHLAAGGEIVALDACARLPRWHGRRFHALSEAQRRGPERRAGVTSPTALGAQSPTSERSTPR